MMAKSNQYKKCATALTGEWVEFPPEAMLAPPDFVSATFTCWCRHTIMKNDI